MSKRNVELAIDIGKRIANRRKELGWTQEQAAEKTSLSQQFFACVERGLKGIGAESVIKICNAMNISADYLLTGAISDTEHTYWSRLLEPMDEEQRKATMVIVKNVLIACKYPIPKKQERCN